MHTTGLLLVTTGKGKFGHVFTVNDGDESEEQNGAVDNTCTTETVPPPGFHDIATLLPEEGPTIVPPTTVHT
jgi:hypothetical protein